MNTKQRIGLEDTAISAIMKLVEGNPGATSVCGQMLRDGEAIDPDGALGGFGALLMLDSLGIYGSQIWILYKDRCGQNIARTLAVLRAWQLGFISAEELVAATSDRMESSLDVSGLYDRVKAKLPSFDPHGLGAARI